MTVDSSIWSTLVDLNKVADSLIARARKRIEPSPPVSRELLTNASIEVRFNNLPQSFDPEIVTPANSDVLWGNNVKRGFWTNGGSRLYLRELYLYDYQVLQESVTSQKNGRNADQAVTFPPYYRWNLQTSITQKQYADKRVSRQAGGRKEAGNHLSFRDPLVIEPMETVTFEVELLCYGELFSDPEFPVNDLIVSLYLSGYREGM